MLGHQRFAQKYSSPTEILLFKNKPNMKTCELVFKLFDLHDRQFQRSETQLVLVSLANFSAREIEIFID